MTPEEFESERLESARELSRVVDGAQGSDAPRASKDVLGPVAPSGSALGIGGSPPEQPALAEWNPPAPPNLEPVNASWQPTATRGPGSFLSLVDGREKTREAQAQFNSDQVRLDNALIAWTSDHFAATHKHYDSVIAQMQKRMDDIDTRHRELERELVRHVHEMAQRIDVVLGEGEKGRVSHEAALRSVRERLRVIEEKLR